ncbi:hypothetical protein FOL47_007244, partial [Perkinsus chesapeaki]
MPHRVGRTRIENNKLEDELWVMMTHWEWQDNYLPLRKHKLDPPILPPLPRRSGKKMMKLSGAMREKQGKTAEEFRKQIDESRSRQELAQGAWARFTRSRPGRLLGVGRDALMNWSRPKKPPPKSPTVEIDDDVFSCATSEETPPPPPPRAVKPKAPESPDKRGKRSPSPAKKAVPKPKPSPKPERTITKKPVEALKVIPEEVDIQTERSDSCLSILSRVYERAWNVRYVPKLITKLIMKSSISKVTKKYTAIYLAYVYDSAAQELKSRATELRTAVRTVLLSMYSCGVDDEEEWSSVSESCSVTLSRIVVDEIIANSVSAATQWDSSDTVSCSSESITDEVSCGIVAQRGLDINLVESLQRIYTRSLGGEHPAVVMLSEKLHTMLVDLQEGLQYEIDQLGATKSSSTDKTATPYQVHKLIEKYKRALPQKLTGILNFAEEELKSRYEIAEGRILEKLRRAHSLNDINDVEQYAIGQLGTMSSRVWPAITKHRRQRQQFLEYELETRWEWPLSGSLIVLDSAARQYVNELGRGHPILNEFLADRLRLETRYIDEMMLEMVVFGEQVKSLQQEIDNAKVKHLRMEYQRQLAVTRRSIRDRLEDEWTRKIGSVNGKMLEFAKATLGDEEYREFISFLLDRDVELLDRFVKALNASLGSQATEVSDESEEALDMDQFGQEYLEKASKAFLTSTEALRDRTLLYNEENEKVEEPSDEKKSEHVGHSEDTRDEMAEFEAIINKMMLTNKPPTDEDAVQKSNMMAAFANQAVESNDADNSVEEMQDEQGSIAHIDEKELVTGLSPVFESLGSTAPPLAAKLKLTTPLPKNEAEDYRLTTSLVGDGEGARPVSAKRTLTSGRGPFKYRVANPDVHRPPILVALGNWVDDGLVAVGVTENGIESAVPDVDH